MSKAAINVLVVDDEEIDSALIRRILEAAGFIVYAASSFEDALRIFEETEAELDLLLADVSLPTRSGIELARVLRRKKPTLKVLFTSGWVGAELVRTSG